MHPNTMLSETVPRVVRRHGPYEAMKGKAGCDGEAYVDGIGEGVLNDLEGDFIICASPALISSFTISLRPQ
jgi:hypothetical protein